MIDDPDLTAVTGIICATGGCEQCQTKARDVLAAFAYRLAPPGASIQMFTDYRWLNARTNAEQTALSPREDVSEWMRVKRRTGRWYGPWEAVDGA